jgi:hypothetical protein
VAAHQMHFLHLLKWSYGFVFPLSYVIRGITFSDLDLLNHIYIPGMNPTWLWQIILLKHCWIQFGSIFWRIIASMFIKDIDVLLFISIN